MSQKPSGYERIQGDKYYTPAWVTDALLSVEKFDGAILDPGAGAGHIVDALKARGQEAAGIDISPDAEGIDHMDFFYVQALAGRGRHIVANPAYGTGGRIAVDFIKHSLALTQVTSGKVAMLLRVDFDSANGRRPIFQDHPAFAAKYALTKRIRWANLEQSGSGPTENHCWMVWDWARRRDTARAYGYLP